MIAWLRLLLHRLRSSFADVRVDRDLAAEMAAHLDFAIEDNLRRGMPADEARRQALIRFGGLEQATQRHRDARGLPALGAAVESIRQDVRYGWRSLRKNPGFTAVAILTLALGIGANTVIFSVIDSVLLRSLPFRDPDRLVKVSFDDPGVGLSDALFSVPEFEDLKSRPGVFEDVSAVSEGSVNLTGASQPARLELLVVSPGYFSILGVAPRKGRLFGPQDVAPGFAEAAVISDGLWRRCYGAAPDIIGRSVRLDNDLYTIVGVLPPAFRHPAPATGTDVEVWLTAGFSAAPAPQPTRGTRVIPGAIARLRPGVTLREAQARLDAMSAQVRKEFPSDYPSRSSWTVRIVPLRESLVGNVRPLLLLLMGAVVLVVLIASVNIANLLLARASGRQREMSMRLALGASRPRLVRQLLTESMLLSLVAGAVGILSAELALNFLLRLMPFHIPRRNEIGIDWVVLAFAAAVSLVTGLVFGLAPALQSARSDLHAALREGARGSGYSARTQRLRSLLVVSELALTVILMIGAGLLMRTFWRLLAQDPGFNPARVVVSSIWLPIPNDPNLDPYLGIARQGPFVRELLRRAGAIPGVELAGLTSDLPGTPARNSMDLTVEDLPAGFTQKLSAEVIRVSPDYFRIIQTPLLHGRFFTGADRADGLPVALIDETTAHRFWPDRDPIGRRFAMRGYWNVPWVTVVGIVKDIKQDGLQINGVPHIYTSVFQDRGRDLHLVLRTSLAPSLLEPQIRAEIQAVDPGLPVYRVRSMNEVLASSLALRSFSVELVGAFAAMALLLASIGIYGVLAYVVRQRRQEIGVRIALGAARSDVLKLVLRQGAFLAGAGVSAGVVLAAVAAPAIATLLYGIHAIDPIVFLGVPLILFLVGFAASYVPARQAARVSPIVALREG